MKVVFINGSCSSSTYIEVVGAHDNGEQNKQGFPDESPG